MLNTTWFPYAVGFLELGAAIVYFGNEQYRLAITWLAYAIAAISLGGL